MEEVVHFDIAELLSSPELRPTRGSAGDNSLTEYTGYEPRSGDEVLHVPSSISPEELWDRFISKRRPVIIDGFPTDPEWQAHKWTNLERLRELAGDSHVKVEPIHPSFGHFGTGTTRTHTTFGQFLDVLQDPEEAGKWYLTTQYESGSEAEDQEESDSSSDAEHDDFDAIDQQLQNLESAIGTETLASVILAEGQSRKRKRSESSESEPASATDQQGFSTPETAEASSVDQDEMERSDEGFEEEDEHDDISVQQSDSEEEPDLDDILPSPTHALVTDFPAQPKLTGGLVLQQCNLWLGSSASPTTDLSARPVSTSATSPSPLPGKSSGLHHDFHDNLYALLAGRKRLLLFPPSAHRFLHPRGPILRVHKNGLIVYGPRDHEIDHDVAQDLLNSASLFGPDGPDLETLEYLRDRHYSIGRQRSLALRPDGLTTLDAAKWRIRARARALAEANERAAAAAGERRIHRDRRKGKARQTREQEEALQRYQAAKKEFLLQRLIEEDDDEDDDDEVDEDLYHYSTDESGHQLTAAQIDAILRAQDESDELDSDIAGLMEEDDEDEDDADSFDISSPGFFDLEEQHMVIRSTDGPEDDDDDDNASSDSTQDSLDLMEDIFEQQKTAILALRDQAETLEEEELQTHRLQVLVRRRQEVLEAREANADGSDNRPSKQRQGKKQLEGKQKSKSGRANGRKADSAVDWEVASEDDDDDEDMSEPEGWMMFDDLEKERRMQEDAEEEDESESEDAEDGSSEGDEDEDDDDDDTDVDEGSEDDSEDAKYPAKEPTSKMVSETKNGAAAQARSALRGKVKNVTKKRQPSVASRKPNTNGTNGLVEYSDEDDEEVHESTSTSNAGDANSIGTVEGETELDRALRLNGVDDSRLRQAPPSQSPKDDDESEDESSGDFFGSDPGDEEDEDQDGDGIDMSMIEDGEAVLQALERKAQKVAKHGGGPSEELEEEDEDEDDDQSDEEEDDDDDDDETDDEEAEGAEDVDEQKEPSSFSRIKPHVLHAFYGLDSSLGPDADKKQAAIHKAGTKKKSFDPSTSMSTAEHPFHCALNFWFHPPTNLASKRKDSTKKKNKNKKGRAAKGKAEKKGAGADEAEQADAHHQQNGSSAAAASSQAAEKEKEDEEGASVPSAMNPYEDAEVWDEIRRTVAKLVRDARRRAEAARLERAKEGMDDEGPSQDVVSLSKATGDKVAFKRRRKG
ncbi:hypothetical protein OC845_002151 [Tilletia horrida]|nr:hypothetical protein OC845_002151 [Tilletia horrida]